MLMTKARAGASAQNEIQIPMPTILSEIDAMFFGAPTTAVLSVPFQPELTDKGDLMVWERTLRWERTDVVTGLRNVGQFKRRRIGAHQVEAAVASLFAKRGDTRSYRPVQAGKSGLTVALEDFGMASFVTTPPLTR